MNQSVKKIGCVILSGILGMSMMPISVYAQENHPTEKTETVFTVLNGDGSVDSSIVSAWLHDEDGIQNIQEDLQLSNVENVKTDEQPSVDGNTYTWNAKGNDVYYQGNSEKELPVEISIQYILDGKEIAAQDVKGKSGHLHVVMHCTPKISKVVQGITIHPSYVLGGALIVDDGMIENLSSAQGKIIDDGNRKVFVFATVPGLQQTLSEAGLSSVASEIQVSDTIEWEADVHDYDQSEMMMAMSNELEMDALPQIPSLASLDILYEAEDQLVEGTKALNEGAHQLQDGIQPLTHATDKIDALKSGVLQLNEGSHVLKDSVDQYVHGVKQLDDGNKQLYQISQGAGTIHSSVQSQLVPGAEALELGLAQLEQAIDAPSFQAVLTQVQAQLKAMDGMIQKDKTIVDSMVASLEQVDAAKTQMMQMVQAFQMEVQSMNQTIVQDNEKIAAYNEKSAALQAQKEQLLQSLDQAIALLQNAEDEESKASLASLQAQRQEIASIDVSNAESLQMLDATKMMQYMAGIQKGMEQFGSVLTASSQNLASMADDVKTAQAALSQLEQVKDAMHLEALQQAIHDLHAGSIQMKEGTLQLQGALQSLETNSKAGIDTVNQGSSLLSSKGEELQAGTEKLTGGVDQFASKADQIDGLKDKMAQLDDAVSQLSEGTQTLYDGQSKFQKEGIQTLKDKLDLTMSQVQTLETILSEIQALNKENKVFAGTPDGSVHTSRFVFRMK